MKKLLFFPLAVAMLTVCACGNKTEANADGADSSVVEAVDSDSIRQADSLKAAAEQAKADSVKAAEEAKKAEEAKAAAGSKKADQLIADLRDVLKQTREMKGEGIPGGSRYAMSCGGAAEDLQGQCKAEEKNMSDNQKAEYKKLYQQIIHEIQTWD